VPSRRRILIVSHDRERSEPLVAALGDAGYVAELRTTVPVDADASLLLLDMVAGVDWPAIEGLRRRFMLIVDGPETMRRGFALEAEDCVLFDAKPQEITARCDAVLRRTDTQTIQIAEDIAVYVDRRLWVNFNTRQVWVQGRPAHLTPREFRLLKFLIQHRDETLDHDQILETVWGRNTTSGRPTEVLKQYVWRLRQKVELDPNEPDTILTDPGAGYRFVSRLD
jgi:DNA-binding response OmpR family regulator